MCLQVCSSTNLQTHCIFGRVSIQIDLYKYYFEKVLIDSKEYKDV